MTTEQQQAWYNLQQARVFLRHAYSRADATVDSVGAAASAVRQRLQEWNAVKGESVSSRAPLRHGRRRYQLSQ